MKKQIILLIVCLVVAAGLGGACWFLLGYEPAGEESSSSATETVSLLDRPETDLDTITVENAEGGYTIKNLGDGNYQIVEIPEAQVTESAVSNVAKLGTSITAKSMVTDSPENLDDFGLGTPVATLTATYTDGTSFELLLGNHAPDSNGVYLKPADDPAVYLISSYDVDRVFDNKLEFISTTVTSDPAGAAAQQGSGTLPEKVTFGGSVRTEPIVIEKDQTTTEEEAQYNLSTYIMTSPKERSVDAGDATNSIASLLSITADSVVAYDPTEEELASYGLDTPYSTVDFTYKDADEQEHSVSLRVSAVDEEGNVYLQKDNEPVVYQLEAEDLSWYSLTYGDFISTLQLLPYINDVKTVSVVSPDVSYVFELETIEDEDAKEDLKVTLNGSEVDTSAFRSLYQTIIGIPSENYTEDTPPDPETALLTVTFTYHDGRPDDVIALLPGPSRKVFLSINGDAEFYTKASYVDTILQNCVNIQEGKEIVPLY